MRFAAQGLFALVLFAVPGLAQVNQIKISMSPGDGIPFTVDGQVFQGSAAFLWPQGSKHTVSVQPTELGNTPKALYGFTGWTINTFVTGTGPVMQPFNQNVLIVTADPSVQ